MKKYFKSYILFALMALTFAGCKTDDLKDDLDDLKDRVTLLEEQVKILNDNLEVISYLFNEKIVITSCTPNGTAPDYTSYTIKFSDNTELELNLGSESSVRLPDMEIVEGKWVIEGVKTEVPVSNDTPGSNGLVPKFELVKDETGKYYYTVQYGEKEPKPVTDAEGNKIYVTIDDKLPEDPEFVTAKMSDDGKYFVLTLKTEPEQTKNVPIVSDLSCELYGELYSFYENKWIFANEATQTVKLKVSGDDILVNAPAGWTYSIGEKDADGIVAISVTAPKAAVSGRATADNKEDLSVMVNKDNYWAVWKTKVGILSTGKYSDFLSAGNIIIDGNTINKDGNFYYRIGDPYYAVTKPGVYFLARGLKWTANISKEIDGNLYFINEADDNTPATVDVKNQISFTNVDDLYFSGVVFDASQTVNAEGSLQYPIMIGSNGHIENLVFHKSVISIVKGKSLSFISDNKRWITNLKIKDSDFICNESGSYTLIGISSAECFEYNSIELVNNIFYSNKADAQPNFIAFTGNKGGVKDFKMENNTFVKVRMGDSGLLNIGKIQNQFIMKNNIFWYDYNMSKDQFIINAAISGPVSGEYNSNITYNSGTNKNWNVFKPTTSVTLTGEDIKVINEDPFTGGTFDLANGKFVPNDTYKQYGATRN